MKRFILVFAALGLFWSAMDSFAEIPALPDLQALETLPYEKDSTVYVDRVVFLNTHGQWITYDYPEGTNFIDPAFGEGGYWDICSGAGCGSPYGCLGIYYSSARPRYWDAKLNAWSDNYFGIPISIYYNMLSTTEQWNESIIWSTRTFLFVPYVKDRRYCRELPPNQDIYCNGDIINGIIDPPHQGPSFPIATVEEIDSQPLGKRIPFVLIHGNNMEDEPSFGWKKYLKKMAKNSEFNQMYKVYLAKWDSEKSNRENGMALGKAIDNTIKPNRQVVILAHSRGGIIARYFMNYYTIQNGLYAGQLGGEKVKWLITLGTPHRGSPGADPIWVSASFDYNFPPPVELALLDIYFTEPVPLIPFLPQLYRPESYEQMLWDDSNDEQTEKAVCYNSALSLDGETCCPLMSKTSLNVLPVLNRDERYLGRIITYGGNNSNKTLIQKITEDIESWILLTNYQVKTVARHSLLDLSTTLLGLMPSIPPGFDRVPNNPDCPFVANDGMVPLESALFLEPGASDIFRVKRNKMKYDKATLSSFCQVYECNILEGPIDHLDL